MPFRILSAHIVRGSMRGRGDPRIRNPELGLWAMCAFCRVNESADSYGGLGSL